MEPLVTALVVICLLFPLLSAAILTLRLLARNVKAVRIQLEDFMIFAAWVGLFAVTSTANDN